MTDIANPSSVFSGFQALRKDANESERDQLFRNMGMLFSHVSERCDDVQVTEYDEVLCALAERVAVDARVYVAGLLAPLERAPGSVISLLAKDMIDVARPLLKQSNVLCDDDLIDIVRQQTEGHRVVIAGRTNVGERVGDAIADNGGQASISRLVGNETANLGAFALEKAVIMAANDSNLAKCLKSRQNIDWKALRNNVGSAGSKALGQLTLLEPDLENVPGTAGDQAGAHMHKGAEFSASEWKIAWNQVKALSDRRQLNISALARFVRFGYSHHVAVAMSLMTRVPPEQFIRWLATQDYVGITVASRTFGLSPELFIGMFALLPWREAPRKSEFDDVCSRFEKLGREEAAGIFKLWRTKTVLSGNSSKARQINAA